MSTLVYGGNDLSGLCTAQVVGRSLNSVGVEAMRVAGRAGAVSVDSWVPPEDVRVRLMLDPGYDPGTLGLSDARHRLRSWLGQPGGGRLVLPDDPELEYRDAFLVDAGDWTQLFEDGECVVTFTLLDPVAWGLKRYERGESFAVGGTWHTWPSFSLMASAGGAVEVHDAGSGRFVRVERSFLGGESVVINCDNESVTIDGADARVAVTLQSDFFAVGPGSVALRFEGCSCHETFFVERWL